MWCLYCLYIIRMYGIRTTAALILLIARDLILMSRWHIELRDLQCVFPCCFEHQLHCVVTQFAGMLRRMKNAYRVQGSRSPGWLIEEAMAAWWQWHETIVFHTRRPPQWCWELIPRQPSTAQRCSLPLCVVKPDAPSSLISFVFLPFEI